MLIDFNHVFFGLLPHILILYLYLLDLNSPCSIAVLIPLFDLLATQVALEDQPMFQQLVSLIIAIGDGGKLY